MNDLCSFIIEQHRADLRGQRREGRPRPLFFLLTQNR